MSKKRLISTTLLLVFAIMFMIMFVGCGIQEEIQIPSVQQDVYVYDQDGCIDDEVEAELNSLLVELEEKTEAEFAVVSISSLNGYTIEEYANKLFNSLGIGKDDKDNGVLLLLSRSDTKVRLEIGRGLEGYLNDAKCGRILDEYFVPYREKDNYAEGTRLTVNAVLTVIAEEYQVELQGLEQLEFNNEDEADTPVWVYIVIFIIVIIVAFLKASKEDWTDSHYYGGHSSGGSFRSGGFGGGRSGGGGASR